MMSGLFFAAAVLRYGVTRFRESFINTGHSDIRIGAWWDWAVRLVVVQALVLIVWWFWQVRTEDPWGTFGWANMAVQWAVALAFFIALNGWLGALPAPHTRPAEERRCPPLTPNGSHGLREFERRALEEWERIPEQYRAGVDGLRVERGARRTRRIDDVYTLGECHRESYPSEFGGPETDAVASSCCTTAPSSGCPAWTRSSTGTGELWETLTHELQHHLESLAADDALVDMDYAADENFKRYHGEPFDPWFFRHGMPETAGSVWRTSSSSRSWHAAGSSPCCARCCGVASHGSWNWK
jgi:hypothetical protein